MATEPTAGMMQAAEECAAKTALQGTDGAVGAYDKLPMASASCLFTMDTSTDIFILHSFQVQSLMPASPYFALCQFHSFMPALLHLALFPGALNEACFTPYCTIDACLNCGRLIHMKASTYV